MNVVQIVSNKVWGGGEQYALDLSDALARRGHNVKVFTRRVKAVEEPFVKAGLEVGHLNPGGVFDVITPVRLASVLNHLQGDTIIHVHNFKDAAVALTGRRLYRGSDSVKVVCSRHLVRPAKTDAHHMRMYAALDAIIFISQVAMDAFVSSLPAGARRDNLRLVMGAIAHPADATPPRAEASPLKLLFAGRIDPEKGLDTLLQALGSIDPALWQLEICGTGSAPYVARLDRLARSLDIDCRISWAGHVDDVAEHMAAADVLVLPSIVPESFGMVIVEAFATGRPVVSTANGAQREIITDGVDGLLVAPSDAQALASAIRRFIDNPRWRGEASLAARRKFDSSFTYNRFINEISTIYDGR